MSVTNTLKKQAALYAIDLVEDGMVVGLGTGSTAAYAIEGLAKRIKSGLNIVAIPTSEKSRLLAEKHSIPLTSFAKNPTVDITIDGADQVEIGSLNLVKGLGGALLHEKIVACASKKLIIIVDESKLVNCLGNQTAIPIEVIPFGWEITKTKVNEFCSSAVLRLNKNNEPYKTDSGNYILDCQIAQIKDVIILDNKLKSLTGVVETGFFINLTSLVIVAKKTGIETLQKNL